MSKAIEENYDKKTCIRIQFTMEIYGSNKNNDNNKTNLTPNPSTPVAVFLIDK